ncbi:hypothetical protein HQ520_12665, partial [bacterium]|nr:hypothetical protein [bacterium]
LLSFAMIVALAAVAPVFMRMSPEQRIESEIQAAATALEKGQIELIDDILSVRYTGKHGGDKVGLMKWLSEMFNETETRKVDVEEIRVEIDPSGQSAVAIVYFQFSGVFTGSDIYNRLPFRGLASPDGSEPDRITLYFQKEADGAWRIVEFELAGT